MAEPVTIKQSDDTQDIFDIRYLRETGISLLQHYSGSRWTDYNIHDPGVTLLETLCMALAEAGYRADFDITELLGKHSQPGHDSPFAAPETALPGPPVTTDDIRRVLLGSDGVRNVHIRPSKRFPEFAGIFEAEVQLAEDPKSEVESSRIREELLGKLNDGRKPGEEIVDIIFLESEYFGFDIDIEVDARVDSGAFFHDIATAIDQYLSPFVHLYSIENLLSEGYDLPAIFDGPLMRNGFTKAEELSETRFRHTIYTSDLVNVLMHINHVKSVRKLVIHPDLGERHFWSCEVSENKVPRISHTGTHITIWYRGSVVGKHTLADTRIDRSLQSLPKPYEPGQLLKSAEVQPGHRITEYSALQNDLPQAYGVSELGLSGDAPVRREALANQLKGYLRHFDQLLYNTLLQISYGHRLLSTEMLSSTYQAGLVVGAPGEEFLHKPFVERYLSEHINFEDRRKVRNEWKKFLDDPDAMAEADAAVRLLSEDGATFYDRRNRALNHLIARLGYDLSMFEYVCGLSEPEQLVYKALLLRRLPNADAQRGILLKPAGDYINGRREKITGFELRMALLCGIRTETRKPLAAAPDTFFGGNSAFSAEVEIAAEDTDEAIALLFRYGGRPEMYAADRSSGTVRLVLYDTTHRPVAHFSGDWLETGKTEDAARHIAARFASADLESEGFHLVDHLLLRPADELPCFGFDAAVENEVIFSCTPALDRKTRDELCTKFLAGAGKKEQYLVVEKALHQYCVAHRVSAKHLHGTRYFSTREDAEAAIAAYAEQLGRDPGIIHTTLFRDTYSNTDDPFSNALTYVLPSWPSRFGNEALRRYIEETIIRETPAHLAVNIRWMSYSRMREFEAAWSEWLRIRYENSTGDPLKCLQRLIALIAA